MIRVLIVDDEPLAREGVRLHLAREAGVVIAGEAPDGRRAVAMINSMKPDLVLLDVQMPLLDGFEVVESVAATYLPTMRKAREEIAARGTLDSRQRLLQLIADRAGPSAHLQRFVIRSGEGYELVPAADVVSFEAQGNYVRLRTEGGQHLLRITMVELEKRLDPQRFARIHRSTMVSIDRIKEITPAWHGDFEVLLADGQRLRLSRNFRERLLP
jgi:two-component system LytT family response regulator